MWKTARLLWFALLDFIFPSCCVLCHTRIMEGNSFLCPECEGTLPRLPKYFRRVDELEHPPPPPHWFESSLAVYYYNDQVQRLVHLFKYHKTPQLAAFWAGQVSQVLSNEPDMPAIDCLVPIPLHSTRYRERGYNQAALLAKEISRQTCIPVREDVLKRITKTSSQASKNRLERMRNIRGAFAVNKSKSIQNSCIALVDDVVTTGSTMNECARILRQARVRRVIAISITRIE